MSSVDINQIRKINNLPKDEQIKFIQSLKTVQAQIEVFRILMPPKLLPILNKARYKFVYGGRGAAKSRSFAKALVYIGNKRKIRVLCAREFQMSMKDSVHSELKTVIKNNMYTDYETPNTGIYNRRNETEFIFAGLYGQDSKQSIKSYSDIDYCWIEEAQAASEGSLSILIPTIRKHGSEIWFSFNRLFIFDPIWQLKERTNPKRKIEINVNWQDNPFISQELLEEREDAYKAYLEGKNHSYPHVWDGTPMSFGEKIIIPYDDIMQAVRRNASEEGGVVIGADIARYGDDRSVFFKRKGLKVIDYKIYQKTSVIETARHLIDFVGRHNVQIPILIDDSSMGGGVRDYLEEFGYNMVPILFNQRAKETDKYNNAISEMWFEMKDRIKEIQIPDLQDLHVELASRQWKIDIKARRCVESKDDYKKRGYRSPDLADALLLCFYQYDFADSHIFMDGLV